MKLFVVIYNDARLLSHFLSHYTSAGITDFFIAVAPAFRDEVQRYADRYRITAFDDLDVLDSLLGGSAAVTEMRRRAQRPGEWVVIVDLDEFIEFPCQIGMIVEIAEREGANVVRGVMRDRFTPDGQPAEITPESDLPQVFPITSRFIRDVMHTRDHKGVLVKGGIRAAAAHHRFEHERVCSTLLDISHYKWIAGAVDRLRDSYERVVTAQINWGMQVNWGIEYKRALDHYDAHGRFAWEAFGGQPKTISKLEPGERCADCRAPVSWQEDRYSVERFGRALCRAHQQSCQDTGVGSLAQPGTDDPNSIAMLFNDVRYRLLNLRPDQRLFRYNHRIGGRLAQRNRPDG